MATLGDRPPLGELVLVNGQTELIVAGRWDQHKVEVMVANGNICEWVDLTREQAQQLIQHLLAMLWIEAGS